MPRSQTYSRQFLDAPYGDVSPISFCEDVAKTYSELSMHLAEPRHAIQQIGRKQLLVVAREAGRAT